MKYMEHIMAKKEVICYTAQDCSEINYKDKSLSYSDTFLHHVQSNSYELERFRISSKHFLDESPIVEYDYRDGKWKAGRYIGSIKYRDGKNEYCLSISPRFGESALVHMLSEIFNIKITEGTSGLAKDSSAYIKMLISMIWTQKLNQSNRFGLPRTSKEETNKGYFVKGKLVVLPSVFSYHKDETIISVSRNNCYDKRIVSILCEAYRILCKDFCFDRLPISPSTKKLIKGIESLYSSLKCTRITENEYNRITYSPIYKEFKEIVDFSWSIINTSWGVNGKSEELSVSGYLLDMAEIWECYVRKILQKKLQVKGWQLIDTKYHLYKGQFFERDIIPDIVFKNGDKYCVFDAKYKKMMYRKQDVDRSDFFQIHTYASYFQGRGNVILAGLVYPIENTNNIISPPKLFGNDESDTIFFVDGPRIAETDEIEKTISNDLFLNSVYSVV